MVQFKKILQSKKPMKWEKKFNIKKFANLFFILMLIFYKNISASNKGDMPMKMKLKIGNSIFTASLENNSSVKALKELLNNKSLTLQMKDYAGMEKTAELSKTLPQNNIRMNTQAGDIILYQGRTFVIYYDTNLWSLTPIGKIENLDIKKLRQTLGKEDVVVTISIE